MMSLDVVLGSLVATAPCGNDSTFKLLVPVLFFFAPAEPRTKSELSKVSCFNIN